MPSMPHTMTHKKDNCSGRGMVLTDRDRRLISDVASFGVLTRRQLQDLGHFHSVTRANAVLLRLTRFSYLSVRPPLAVSARARAVYALGRRGAELCHLDGKGSRFGGASDLFVHHQLLVNDIRILFGQDDAGYALERWMTDLELGARGLGLLPDGYVEYSWHGRHFSAFIEADRGTETLDRWLAKVNGYVGIAQGPYQQGFGRRFFRVLVVAESERRLENIQKAVARRTDRLFWFAPLGALRAVHPIHAGWLRPDGSVQQLTQP